jgi:HSP20 family molecular chaperone IbpA
MSQLLNQLKTLERRMHSPKTDLVETSTSYIIRMELAVKEFEWNIKDGQYLFVTYTKEQDYELNDMTDSDEEPIKIVYSETKYGKNIRRVKLPSKISGEVLSESWDYGVWIIRFLKNNQEISNDIHSSSVHYTPINSETISKNQDFLQNEPFQPIEMGSWADE